MSCLLRRARAQIVRCGPAEHSALFAVRCNKQIVDSILCHKGKGGLRRRIFIYETEISRVFPVVFAILFKVILGCQRSSASNMP
jgi:hypothetical protein